MNNKTFIIVILVMITVAAVTLSTYLPSVKEKSVEPQMADFPKAIGEWQSEDIALNERDYEILDTKNLIMREYKNSKGESLYLYIIYSADNRKALHPPEVCYSGGGSAILKKSVAPLTNTLTANYFLIESGTAKQIVVYWFKSTYLSTYSYIRQQIKIVTDRLFRRKTAGAMIRLSTIVKNDNQSATLELIKSFVGEIEPLLSKYVP